MNFIPSGNTTFVQMMNELYDIEKFLDESVRSNDISNLQPQLQLLIQQLIERDFSILLQCLYKIDVDEKKLKAALLENNNEPAKVISEMIIERRKQKAALRARHKQDDHDIPAEEKW